MAHRGAGVRLLSAALVLALAACSGTPAASSAIATDAASPLVSSPPTTAASSPSASPSATAPGDRSWIAYQWDLGDGARILLVRLDGTDQHVLRPRFIAYHPDWSPDGTQVAFDAETGGGNEIWVINADGTETELIVAGTRDCAISCGEVAEPAWSPDGSKIAFVRFKLGASGLEAGAIEVQDIASGDRHVVFRAPLNTALDDPRWSSDGRAIAFTMTRYPDSQITLGTATGSAIAVISVTEANVEPLVLTDWSMFANYPDWRPGSDEIVFSTYGLGEFQATDEPSNLYIVKPDGSGLTALTTFGNADQRATQPTWTPDGSRIIFTLVGQQADFDNPRHAAFIDADGSNLVDTEITATHPRLRPGTP